MSSGALTAALGRSNRDRDITDLVPSAPECSYAACFCEVYTLKFYTLICLLNHGNFYDKFDPCKIKFYPISVLGKCLETS